MHVSVVFSTYESPAWLEKTLWGLLEQTHPHFEIVVADDGSGPATRDVIETYRGELAARGVSVRHERQDDEGFRKCRILNRAILACAHDYVVFTDGDCILRRDFLAVHVVRSAPGRWLSGSYYKLPMDTSRAISRDDVRTGRCFDRAWLRARGLPASAKRLKLTRSPTLARVLNRVTPTACNLKGANASAWRADLVRVGGFDERMQWGGLDRELGVRLTNAGVRPRHVRYDAVCLHLDHARGYKDPERVAANKRLRLAVQRDGTVRTAHGIGAGASARASADPPAGLS